MCYLGPKFMLFFFIVSISRIEIATAQQTPVKKDSLYKEIESYSKKNKFTKFVYSLVFKPTSTSKKKSAKKVYKKLIQKSYSPFEGKTIRHITIETLDPFGYSIADTMAAPKDLVSKTGNSLHVKSQHITVRNLLLIHQNQIFDSLLVKESERLVRTMGYVHDVSFFIKAVAKNSDSVDIHIREMDNWSIFPSVSVSTTSFNINLTDKNFLGLGHESQNEYTWHPSPSKDAYGLKYFIPNFRNTFVNSTIQFDKDPLGNSNRNFAVDRPFFSPFAKWAAGVNFLHQFRNDFIHTSDSLVVPQRFKLNTQDFWVGNAIRIFKGNTEDSRTTNFITAIRFFRVRYLEKPIEQLDIQHFYSNENFYMASIGISTRKYVQDKYIFNFGLTEDVPIGRVYSLTGGYQVKNNTGRLYLGMRFSYGNYNEWGYLSTNLEYGTFFRASHSEQGTLTIGMNYFTGLIEVGKWKFRQFIKPQLTIGINRLLYDSLTLHKGYGLDGFNSSLLTGTKRILFTLQTQSYAPWNFIGFRFGPYLIYSMGMLGDEQSGFRHSKPYSQIGIGVLIKNEKLVFNTFQVSIAFYPSIPGSGQNIFKINSFRTTDFGFRDFEIGKPAVVVFQ
jgi:hypothetical protein